MLKQYIKQALQMLKENRLVSIVSIVGTALSISLVMVMIMLFQIKTANYAPENQRDRTIYASVQSKPRSGVTGNTNNTGFSYTMVKECIYTLQSTEVATATNYGSKCQLALPTKSLYADYRVKWTDANFWKAFSFHFLEGRPYNEEEVQSGLPLVVLSKEIAMIMFGEEKAVGQSILIDRKPHQVIGVVNNVTKAASTAYSQAWVVLSSNADNLTSREEETCGNLLVTLIAPKKGDIPKVKKELKQKVKQFSDNRQSFTVTERIYNFYEIAIGSTREYLVQGSLIILFLLLLPAINLTGITMNNIRQRSSEIGIRKSFGATKETLMTQILMENLVITAIGAIIGFGLSFVFIHFSRSFLLTADTMLTIPMLLQPLNFIAAVFFCLLMNLLSAGIPAWRMARKPIVLSLTGSPS